MHFTCAYCGKGSFTIVSDPSGSPYAMTSSPDTQIESRAQKQKMH